MSKIGILTFQRTVNYGAQFQSYALQQYLLSQNRDVEVIQYSSPALEKAERPPKLWQVRTVKDFIKFFKCNPYHVRRWEAFEAFRREHMKLSAPMNRQALLEAKDCYGAFIVGSDQVWNWDITNRDSTYFLDFEPDAKKKFSYAASFGGAVSEADLPEIRALLSSFRYLNLREKSALPYVRGLPGKTNVVIDPTFLLSRQEWLDSLHIPEKKPEKPYVFAYMLEENQENMSKLYALAKQKQLEIIHVREGFRDWPGITSVRDCAPADFLTLLCNADYVMTGSFHGLCLSIIFQKQFFYILNHMHERNQRLMDLLTMLHLENRDSFCTEDVIDYGAVQPLVDSVCQTSKQILHEMLGEIHE